MQQPFQQCLARLLASQGLTITHAFPVQLFNTNCPPEHALPTFGRPHTTLGIIIGNTNELWAHFIQHLSSQSAAAGLDNSYGDNPLDAYVEAVVTRAVEQSCHQQEVLPPLPALPQQQEQPQPQQNQPQQQHLQQQLPQQQSHNSTQTHTKFALRFSHHTEPGRFVNMMRAAQLSGLAYYSSTTHLCMHPLYGPWFALRAVAVVDADGPDPSGFTQLPCPYPDVEAEAAVKVWEEIAGRFVKGRGCLRCDAKAMSPLVRLWGHVCYCGLVCSNSSRGRACV